MLPWLERLLLDVVSAVPGAQLCCHSTKSPRRPSARVNSYPTAKEFPAEAVVGLNPERGLSTPGHVSVYGKQNHPDLSDVS